MSFDWADYLRLAESLVSNPNSPGPEEAALRAAISRAYYAAFCSARNLAESRGEMIRARRSTDHWQVIDHFQDTPEFVRQQIGADLGRLRRFRNNADYDDRLKDPPLTVARLSVSIAHGILNALNSL
jgi:uncharacterized protein (UPF0332 family)